MHQYIRQFISVFFIAVSVVFITALSAMAEYRSDVVHRINNYLNGIKVLSGEFVQIAADQRISEGSFIIYRPGRVVFRYNPPDMIRVVSDGFWVAVVDEESREVPDRYPLSETPLSLLLEEDVDLGAEDTIRSAEARDGKYQLTAVDPSGEAEGKITMVFRASPLQLLEWSIVDEQGLETRIVLRNVKQDTPIDMADFIIPSQEQERFD